MLTPPHPSPNHFVPQEVQSALSLVGTDEENIASKKTSDVANKVYWSCVENSTYFFGADLVNDQQAIISKDLVRKDVMTGIINFIHGELVCVILQRDFHKRIKSKTRAGSSQTGDDMKEQQSGWHRTEERETTKLNYSRKKRESKSKKKRNQNNSIALKKSL